MRAELAASEIITIADGDGSIDASSPDVVNRDRLRIDTRKWVMSAHNKRYGDRKQIEVSNTISITAALQQAEQRVSLVDVVDVTPRLGE